MNETAPPPAKKAAAVQKKSLLSLMTRVSTEKPAFRLVVTGVEGVGKTTLAANAPAPFFIAAEDGLTGHEYVPHAQPEDWSQALQLLDDLASPEGDQYQTIVIDTIDWLENILFEAVLAEDKKATGIEEYGGGYGKGYTRAGEHLAKFLGKLDKLNQQGKWIIALSHVDVKAHSDPRGETWDRFIMKGNKKLAGRWKEWADAVLFANFEILKTREKGARQDKVIDGGRILHTQPHPAWEAKNRLQLPDVIEFDDKAWHNLEAAIDDGRPSKLRERIKSLVPLLPADKKERGLAMLGRIDRMSPENLRVSIANMEKVINQPAS